MRSYQSAILLGTVSLTALVGGSVAHAQQSGLPNWAGGYFGANLGVAIHVARIQDLDDFLFFGSGATWRNQSYNFTAGAQAGYLFQYGRLVGGIEGDFNALLDNWYSNVPSGTMASEMTWMSTVRARLGFIWGPLWYVTGGVAFADITNTLGYAGNGFNSPGVIKVSGIRTGFVYGGGVEEKLNKEWSVRLEVLFVDFGQRNGFVVVDSKGGPQGFRASFKDQIGLVRAGLNWHW